MNVRENIRKFIMEYCSNTTIHGIRYLTEPRRHWTERVIWMIAIAVALWLCGSSIKDTWTKWDENPVIMKVTESQISTIPFPMVTICPHAKILKPGLIPVRNNYEINLNQVHKKNESFCDISDNK